jgi:phosphohistidine phosphatase
MGQSDFDRTLNDRGRRDAAWMCKRLLNFHLTPQRVCASTAERVRETVDFFSEAWPEHIGVEWDRQLYLADEDQVLQVVSETDPSVETLIVFGHNPGLSDTGAYLLHSPSLSLPTSGMVGIRLDTEEWEAVPRMKGQLLFFEYP